MSGERVKDDQTPEEGIRIRLPNGVRKYRRRLISEGRRGEADAVRREGVQRVVRKRAARDVGTRLDRARQELDRTLLQLGETDDPLAQARGAVIGTILLRELGEINTDKKLRDLGEILAEYPGLEGQVADIRDRLLSRLRG